MSWAEVKKINSDLTTPLNLLTLLNHIDLIGSEFDPTADLDLMSALASTNALYTHTVAVDIVLNGVWDVVFNGSHDVGKLLNTVLKIGNPILDSYNTLSQITDQHIWYDIANNPNLIPMLKYTRGNSNMYFSELLSANPQGMMAGLLSNKDKMQELIDTTTDINFLPIKAIRNSTQAFSYMHDSSNIVELTTIGSGIYTVPTGIKTITAVCISGGGAGGGYGGGGGGGGGG